MSLWCRRPHLAAEARRAIAVLAPDRQKSKGNQLTEERHLTRAKVIRHLLRPRIIRPPENGYEFEVWEHGRQQGLAEGTRAALRYILAHGWEVRLGEIATSTGLTVERVAAVLDEIKADRDAR